MKTKCKVCKHKLNKGSKFCSYKCYGIFQRSGPSITLKCKQCKLKFEVSYYRRKAKCCSHKCSSKFCRIYKRKKYKCYTCKKSIIRKTRGARPGQAKTHYCNSICFYNRGAGAHGGLVIKRCETCNKKIIRTKFSVNMKDRKGV